MPRIRKIAPAEYGTFDPTIGFRGIFLRPKVKSARTRQLFRGKSIAFVEEIALSGKLVEAPAERPQGGAPIKDKAARFRIGTTDATPNVRSRRLPILLTDEIDGAEKARRFSLAVCPIDGGISLFAGHRFQPLAHHRAAPEQYFVARSDIQIAIVRAWRVGRKAVSLAAFPIDVINHTPSPFL